MAQQIRKAYVNSSHRASGTPNSFRFEFKEDIQCEGQCHVAVTSCSIPHAFYGIQTGVNDKMYVRQIHPSIPSSSINSILTVEAGNYSATSLSQKISAKLNAAALASASYTVTYSATSQLISITQASGGGFIVYDEHTLKTNGMSGSTFLANPQSLNQVLNTPYGGSGATSWVSNVITLARITELYIRSSTLSNYSTIDSNGRYDVLKRALVDKDFGLVITTDGSVEVSDLQDVSGRTIRSIDVSLTDSHGNLVQMPLDWSFALNFVRGDLE
jgi:hypothetical protein